MFLLPSFRNLPYSKLSDQIFHQRLFAKVWSDSLTFGFRKLDSPLQERQQTKGMFFFQAIILSVRRQIFGLGAAWLFIAPVKKRQKSSGSWEPGWSIQGHLSEFFTKCSLKPGMRVCMSRGLARGHWIPQEISLEEVNWVSITGRYPLVIPKTCTDHKLLAI